MSYSYSERIEKLNSIIKDSKYIRDRVSSELLRFHLDNTSEYLEQYRDFLKEEINRGVKFWWRTL